MNFKLSAYNYFHVKNANLVLCINLLKKIAFGLSKEKYDLLILYSNEPATLKERNPNLFSALFKLGIIINRDFDELSFLISEHRFQVYNSEYFRLTILPTLECNFNCWYCYEDKPSGKMPRRRITHINKLIERLIKNSGLKHFHLDWFGGEPLLYFNEVILPISKNALKLCHENNVVFSNMITTNGFLISMEMINNFKNIELNSFQITLDGDEELHNKIKKCNYSNSYQDTINNILMLIDKLEKPNILLRINYTPKNLSIMTKIINDIPKKYREKIEIALQQVWQTDEIDTTQDVISCNEHFKNAGFEAPLYKLESKYYHCYADINNQAVINYDGNVFKCTARDFANHKPDGFLIKDGSIVWNENYHKRMSKTTIENKHCIACNLLPACWGPCSQKILEFEDDSFDKICNKKGIEKTILFLLDNFYDLKIKSTNEQV